MFQESILVAVDELSALFEQEKFQKEQTAGVNLFLVFINYGNVFNVPLYTCLFSRVQNKADGYYEYYLFM